MEELRKINSFFSGIAFVIAAIVIFVVEDDLAYMLIVGVLGLSLAITGISNLIYYFSMARHMVEGRMILFKGIILLDLGVFSETLTDIPRIYILLYLLALHLFSGAVDVLRGLEAKRYGAPSWKLSFSHGLVNFILVVICFRYLRTPATVSVLYAIGLIYSGIVRMANAFRQTKIVYIQ